MTLLWVSFRSMCCRWCFFSLPLRHAAQVACVSKRFAAAYGDVGIWKRRCMTMATGVDIDAAFAKKNLSWIKFYRRLTRIKISIVITRSFQGRKSQDGGFQIVTHSDALVSEFLKMVARYPRNRLRKGKGLTVQGSAVNAKWKFSPLRRTRRWKKRTCTTARVWNCRTIRRIERICWIDLTWTIGLGRAL